MSNKITTKSSETIWSSLGISERRYRQIDETLQEIMSKNEEIRYSEIAEQASNRLDLSTNEVFFVGFLLGGFSQIEFLLDNSIQEMSEESDLPKKLPVVNQMGYA